MSPISPGHGACALQVLQAYAPNFVVWQQILLGRYIESLQNLRGALVTDPWPISCLDAKF